MKNISIITLLLLMTLLSYSQEIVPLEEQFEYVHTGDISMPYYLKDVNNILDKFIGEWGYSDSDHYLKIKLYKIEGINESYRPKVTYDEIRSFILYKEKIGSTWTTVYDTYPTTYTIADLNNQNFNDVYGIEGNVIDTRNYNRLMLNYYEPAAPCSEQLDCLFSITFIDITNPQLLWKLNQDCYGTTITKPCSSIINPTQLHRIPRNLTLNKL
jgi:hypothetical protein